MKPIKPTETRLPLTGPIAQMPWVHVSRRPGPASATKSDAAPIVYGIRGSEDIVQARIRVPSAVAR